MMPWFAPRKAGTKRRERIVPLRVERLETRQMLSATAVLNAGTLDITTSINAINIMQVTLTTANNIVVIDNGVAVGAFSNASVTELNITAGSGFNDITVSASVQQPATITGGLGTNFLHAGSGQTILQGNGESNRLISGSGSDTLVGSSDVNFLGAPSPNVLVGGGGSPNTLIGGVGAKNRYLGYKTRIMS